MKTSETFELEDVFGETLGSDICRRSEDQKIRRICQVAASFACFKSLKFNVWQLKDLKVWNDFSEI